MSEGQAPEPVADGTGRGARIAGWLKAVGVVSLGGFAALLGVFLFIERPPVWPFLTDGRIYVESPGVYTRERLVNDRYSQDFWLKAQLQRLDASADLVRRFERSALAVGAEASPAPDGGPAGAPLAFQDEFLLRAAIRDKIRQMVLENLLDDRHDLTGNSIYGLKFDTAIVPGANTWRRPYVVVRIEAETLPRDRSAADFLADGSSAHNSESGGPFDVTRRQYNGWRRNVEGRLNGYLEKAAKAEGCAAPDVLARAAPPRPAGELVAASDKADAFVPAGGGTATAASAPGPAAPDSGWAGVDRARIMTALRQVLGVEPREAGFGPWFAGGQFGTVDTPEPWSRFFQIQIWRNPDATVDPTGCDVRFHLQLKPVFATILMVEPAEWERFKTEGPLADQPKVLIVSATGEGPEERRVVIAQRPQGSGETAGWAPSAPERAFVESLTSAELQRLAERPDAGVARGACLVADMSPGAGTADCLLRGDRYVVHASQYDFLRAIAQSVPYSYAAFPRGDVEGVLTDRSFAGSADAPGDAASGLSALLQTREVGAEPVVVNFSGGQSEDVTAGDFDFGWAVVRAGRQRPTQVSQLVLVSVPAYLDALELWVETGWLDRDSNPVGPPPDPSLADAPAVAVSGARRLSRMTVALPPDYEAIDTLVVGGTRRQGPVIDDLAFDDAPIELQACRRADLLIPGERLWRSTTVTLGGQIADQITVMPDMRGIVASFVPVAPPQPGERAADGVTLAVWTSEGRDELPGRVTIQASDEAAATGVCPPVAASGNDLPGDAAALAGAADR